MSSVPNPVVVHVVRPYPSEPEYLAAEAWSIDARSMLLIDAEALPADTAVLFDIALSDGHKPIRAEGRVVGPVPAQGERPGGLKVRFKRFGAATKAFIDRAVQAKSAAGEPERTSQVGAELPSQVGAELPSQLGAEPPRLPDAERSSGVSQRQSRPIAAPAHREELLARLRSRRKAAG